MAITNGSLIEANDLNAAFTAMTNFLIVADSRKPTYVNIPVYLNLTAYSGTALFIRTFFLIAPDNFRILSLRQYGGTNPTGETFSLVMSGNPPSLGQNTSISSTGNTVSTANSGTINTTDFPNTNGTQVHFARGGTYDLVYTSTKDSTTSFASASIVVLSNKREN